MKGREGWEVKKIGEMLCKTSTYDPRKKPSEKFIYVDISSIDNETFSIDSYEEILGSEAPSRARKLIKVDDVLFATVRPTLKRIAIVPISLNNQICSTGYFVARTNKLLLNKFLFYLFQSDRFIENMEKQQKGASYPAVTERQIKDYPIIIPPLSIQHQIVAELDALNSIMDKKRAQLEELDKLAQATFYQMFGDPVDNKKEWEVKKMGEVSEIKRGGSPRPISQFLTTDSDGLNWIKIGDTEPNSMFINKTAEKIKPSGLSKTRSVQKGDFLLSNSMSYGRPYILNIDGCIHDGWLVIKDYESYFDKNYLFYLLSSPAVKISFEKMAVGGVVNNLNISKVSSLEVIIPPLFLQTQFAQKIEHIEKQKALIERSITDVQQLFDYTMDRYFS